MRVTSGNRSTILAASSLTLALVSDSVLYLLLPIYFQDFTLTMLWVGILLSANRLVRIVCHPWLAAIHQLLGNRRATLTASLLATLACLCFLILSGPLWLLLARLLWGGAYSFLRLSCLFYATEQPSERLQNLGWYATVQEMGPLSVLLLTPWLTDLLSPHGVIGLSFLLCLLSIVPAWCLPRDLAVIDSSTNKNYPNSSIAHWLTFLSSLSLDGLWAIVLAPMLIQEGVSTKDALFMTALLVCLKRFLNLLCGLWATRTNAYHNITTGLHLSLSFMVIACLLIGAGCLVIGSLIGIMGHAVYMLTMPKWLADVAPQDNRRKQQLHAFTWWRDAAVAAGAGIAGLMLSLEIVSIAYGLVCGTLTVLWGLWFVQQRKSKIVQTAVHE